MAKIDHCLRFTNNIDLMTGANISWKGHVLHDMSADSGFTVSFLLRVGPRDAANSAREPGLMHNIYMKIAGVSDSGETWVIANTFSVTNKGPNPFYRKEADGWDPPTLRNISAESDSLANKFAHKGQYMFSSLSYIRNGCKIYVDRDDKKLSYEWYADTYYMMLGKDGQPIAKLGHELLASNKDHFGLARDGVPKQCPQLYIPWLSDGESWVQVTAHLCFKHSDAFIELNGMRQLVNFMDREIPEEFKTPPVGTAGSNVIEFNLQCINQWDFSNPTVSSAYPVSIDIANLWVGCNEMGSEYRTAFTEQLYDRDIGRPKHAGNGKIEAKFGKFYRPFFYFTGENGFKNNVNGGSINYMDPVDIIKIDEPRTFHMDTAKMPIIRCKTYPYPSDWDGKPYYMFNDPDKYELDNRSNRTKFSILHIDPGRNWRKFSLNFTSVGAMHFSLHNRVGDTFVDYIYINIFPLSDSNGNSLDLEIYTSRYNLYNGVALDWIPRYTKGNKANIPAGTWAFHNIYIDFDNLNSSVWTPHYYASGNLQRSSHALSFQSWTGADADWPMYPRPWKLEAYSGTYAVVGIQERYMSLPSDIPFTALEHSTRLSQLSLYSGSYIDEYPDYDWDSSKNDLRNHFCPYTTGVGKWVIKDLGMDGTGGIGGLKPELFCTARNGLGIFANASNRTLCMGTPVYDSSHMVGTLGNMTVQPLFESVNGIICLGDVTTKD